MVLYVDESGDRKVGEQGDFYVVGGILTGDPPGLEKAVRQVRAVHYPGQDAELKSKKISHPARLDLLARINALGTARVVPHLVMKSQLKYPDRFLGDHHAFYKRTYANLVKLALAQHDDGMHIVTDRHHPTEEHFTHFERCLRFVNGDRVLSVNPIRSSRYVGVQAADVIVGTLRYWLNDHPKGQAWTVVRGSVVQDADCLFPRSKLPMMPKLIW